MVNQLFVIIDPGHGGYNQARNQYMTAGKRSPVWPTGWQLYEGCFNRAVSSLLSDRLNEAGINYAFTVHPSDFRDPSLTSRVRSANSYHARNRGAVLVSVHGNAARSGSASGFEVFTSPGQTRSDLLATEIYNQVNGRGEMVMRHDFLDGDADKEARFSVLTRTTCPAVLVECAFMTNEADCLKMIDPHFQAQMADDIFAGLRLFAENK